LNALLGFFGDVIFLFVLQGDAAQRPDFFLLDYEILVILHLDIFGAVLELFWHGGVFLVVEFLGHQTYSYSSYGLSEPSLPIPIQRVLQKITFLWLL